MLLIAEVYFEQTLDIFFPYSEHIYQIHEWNIMDDKEENGNIPLKNPV
jgi:hypothetical protein